MPGPSNASSSLGPPKAVLFYDGECGLCNNAVRFLLRIDRHARLRFAPLQGPTAQEYLRVKGLPTEDFESMVLVTDWSRRAEDPPRLRTDAALTALREIGGFWRVSALLRVVPSALRDWVYRAIGHSRYRLFGPYRPRPLPHPEWAQRFLS